MGHYHYIFYYLGNSFLNSYRFRFDYVKHNYIFYRLERYTLKDCFICSRSSSHCWKLVYYNLSDDLYFNQSFKKCKYLAKFMLDVFNNNR